MQRIDAYGRGLTIDGTFNVRDLGALPAVVHCVAGKDRTGTVIALLLALLDVGDEEIAADYALSAPALAAYGGGDDRAAAWLAQVPPVLLGADPAAMPAFLAWLRE